jgi:hypothetical protein
MALQRRSAWAQLLCLILWALSSRQQPILTALSILLITATGALEGSVVGLLQWRVLRQPFPHIARREWVMATVAGAMLAWFLGSLPSTLMDMSVQGGGEAAMQEPSPWMVYVLAAGMGFALGPVLGVPQWRVLRPHVRQAWVWIPANCAAWAAGMPVIFIAIDLAQSLGLTAPLMLVAALGAGLFAAGAVVGAVHGVALVWLAARDRTVHTFSNSHPI